MIVDASAIIAILKHESEAGRCYRALAGAKDVSISAANFLEAAIVADRYEAQPFVDDFDQIMADYGISIEPVTEAQARIARIAYRQYGKGSGHPARLNFGDCFAYALARERYEPLLYVGDDFIHTDIRPALEP